MCMKEARVIIPILSFLDGLISECSSPGDVETSIVILMKFSSDFFPSLAKKL